MLHESTPKSLQELIDCKPNLVEFFRNDTLAPHAKDRRGLSPVPIEVTNWRDEQRAWRESVLIFDQSHHMPETFLTGPDSMRLLSDLGINSFANFQPMRAKQYVVCNHQGYFIGETVLQYLEQDSWELISGMHLQNWVQYNAEKGGYDVRIVRDNHTAQNPTGRTNYRYELEGPFAQAVFEALVESEVPDIKFFHLARVRIAGCDVLVLRHSVAGHKGVELSGPYAEGPIIMEALMAAGEKYGIRRAGLKTYFSTLGEVGWIGYPMPAVYTDPALEDFRNWLPADGWEASTQIGGSYVSPNIEDYYFTPYDLGFGKLIKFDHDFVGRQALEAMAGARHRKKVTLVWNDEDIARIYTSLLGEDLPFKFMELPMASYAFQQCDEVRSKDGKHLGLSNFIGYTVNEAKFLSIAVVDASVQEGDEVVVTWGEPDGGTRKPQVEKHRQTTVRAKVAGLPYAKAVRELKNAALVRALA